MFACNCKECELLNRISTIRGSLWLHRWVSPGDGPIIRLKYDDNEEELAHQEGLLRGLEFKYNELVNKKVF